MVSGMERTTIDVDDEVVRLVMQRYDLPTKSAAVDYALRALLDQPMTETEVALMFGTIPDFPMVRDRGIG